jgi:hypothetical protein
MKLTRVLLTLAALATATLAVREWSPAELDAYSRGYVPQWLPRPESLVRGPRRVNYLERVHRLCEFARAWQIADSFSPDFGGLIEAEHLPSIIETDNTQEAIWVWCRWFELTGRDDYAANIRRAWVYVRRHPAYQEHGGNPSSIWYAVWNCGLGFMAETRYRHAYGDTAQRPYADSCRRFYLQNPLGQSAVLDRFVTSQSSGMAYDYALETGDAVLRDTAAARGNRVRQWIETNPAFNLALGNWAMSGGTAFWGVAKSWCRQDTALGNAWLRTYSDSLPGFYPTGSWNCSHSIWLANAYRAAGEATTDETDWLMHQYLLDTLLFKDTDDDGGIPATWTDPPTQDQVWVSTYLDFMGMDPYVAPVYDSDLSVLEFVSPDPRGICIAPCTLDIRVPVTNVGLSAAAGQLTVTAPGYSQTLAVPNLGFLQSDTLEFPPLGVSAPGIVNLAAALGPDDNPRNDTVRRAVKVYGTRTISGTLADSVTRGPIHAWLRCRIQGDGRIWDSCETDRSGEFRLSIIDTLVTIDLRAFAPYFDRAWNVTLAGDTTLDLVSQPAHVLIVNADSASRYASYYTTPLDSIGLSWFLHDRRTMGEPPWPVVGQFRSRAVIWYSGDTRTGTIPPADRDSLAAALAAGTNLLVTGQNIAEELAGTPFLETTLGCRYDSSGWSNIYVWGSRSDPVGAPVTGTATAGGSGAGNQTSRDIVSPLGDAAGFLVYDSINTRWAGVRRQTSAGRAITLGFGLEATNRPNPRPTYWTCRQLVGHLLDWLSPGICIEEAPAARTARSALRASIVRNTVALPVSPRSVVRVYDPAGRLVLLRSRPPDPSIPRTLDVSTLAPGIYFLEGGEGPMRFLKVR